MADLAARVERNSRAACGKPARTDSDFGGVEEAQVGNGTRARAADTRWTRGCR